MATEIAQTLMCVKKAETKADYERQEGAKTHVDGRRLLSPVINEMAVPTESRRKKTEKQEKKSKKRTRKCRQIYGGRHANRQLEISFET